MKDKFTRPIVEEPGMPGYIEPGFSRNESGELVDEAGNIYNEDYSLKVKVRTPEQEERYKRVKTAHPEWSDRYIAEYIRIMISSRGRDQKKKKTAP